MSAVIDKSAGPAASPAPITNHSRIALHDGDGSNVATLRLDVVMQRNWSRIAEASADGRLVGATEERVFVKQFVDSGGTAHPAQWAFEREGIELAAGVIGHVVRVPALLHADRERLLHVYEHLDLLSIDDMLRGDPGRLDRLFSPLVQALGEVLAALASPAAAGVDVARLPTKARDFGSDATAVNFKGMDIRNIGLVDASAQTGPVTLAMFDCGRPYLAPIEEAAAKLFVSIGLLNWGRPVRRFLRGPDTSLLAVAFSTLGPYLDARAVLAEIRYQQRTRERDIKATNVAMLWLKTIGVRTIGRRYMRSLTAWCEQNLPA